MRVDCSILTCMHLDPGYALLSVQNCLTCMEMFNMLDIHRSSKLNVNAPVNMFTYAIDVWVDVQFMLLLKNITNLARHDCEEVFSLLDVDDSGEIEFEEFYLFYCILISNKDSYEKEFIYRHAKTIFQLIDADASGQITSLEFGRMGIFFNFDKSAISRIFTEFDISGDKNLDFEEFKLFTMACIDEARAQDTREKVKAFASYRKRLLNALEPILRRFVRTDRLARPREVEGIVNQVRHPFVPGKKDTRQHFRYLSIGKTFQIARKEIRNYFKQMFRKRPCLFCCCGYFLCCYFCTEDPHIDSATERICRFECKCQCRCIPCWVTFVRKMWTCCYCVFPCCHCCRPSDHSDQHHIARHKEKIIWPDESQPMHEQDEEALEDAQSVEERERSVQLMLMRQNFMH